MPDKPEWLLEAEAKKLPEDFIENLRDTDGFTEEEKAVFIAHVDDAEDFKRKRTTAVEIGRRYGTQESDRRGEIGEDRKGRVAAAMAYAAWEFDGKPLSSERQRKEFGVSAAELVGSLERGSSVRLLQRPKGDS